MTLARRGRATWSVERRLLEKTEKTDGCWQWRGHERSDGYGGIRVDGVNLNAHRVSYELFVGPIPAGMQIDHLCRNRACVRPDHLEPVTCRENVLRGIGVSAVNAQKTECKRHHRLDEQNTHIWNGHRTCRTCKSELQRERRLLRSAGAPCPEAPR